ncbi:MULTISPECIES: DUF5071 domain-containing protein [unclassified Paenibacillus]|uniref:DUF5071 domain-containing protein n=1 Tax=unclassified Paenibacillus TaxID=185978 RepID=UPI0024051444|nr:MULTISPECIES: DUF5071 domain-containing protein [unclassified Paenibacillus]
MPTDKHDFKSVELLSGLEESQVIPQIPELLEWVQDMNWPIATAVADLLAVEMLYKHRVITKKCCRHPA